MKKKIKKAIKTLFKPDEKIEASNIYDEVEGLRYRIDELESELMTIYNILGRKNSNEN
tara:strand:- start:116 stop:289 length:174 start_codon:yes stop_codon:yes gene_type:complete